MAPSAVPNPPRFTALTDWLAWFESLHPKKIDFSLDRIARVLRSLGIDRPRHRVITVGGTNGKGSCVALLESVYLAAGYRVGAFTSPHLWCFNERIRCDGRDAEDHELVELFELIDAALGDVTLSYFEASAVAALLMFARRNVDVAILEVGMGGRLDAVNAVDADVALIVSVDLDHLDWLGPDREAIGREKAGILRAGRPAVIADADPPASLLAAIDEKGAAARLTGRDFSAEPRPGGFAYVGGDAPAREFPRPAFGGELQIRNAGACVAVVDSLASALPMDDAAVARGIAAASARGRLDVRRIDDAEWVFDVAHNAAAVRALYAALEGAPPVRPTVAVFGAMRDKQLDEVVGPFVGGVDHWFVAPIESERRAAPEDLAARLERLGAPAVTITGDVTAATLAARAANPARVLVYGSFYTVGPAMAALGLYCAPGSAG